MTKTKITSDEIAISGSFFRHQRLKISVKNAWGSAIRQARIWVEPDRRQ